MDPGIGHIKWDGDALHLPEVHHCSGSEPRGRESVSVTVCKIQGYSWKETEFGFQSHAQISTSGMAEEQREQESHREGTRRAGREPGLSWACRGAAAPTPTPRGDLFTVMRLGRCPWTWGKDSSLPNRTPGQRDQFTSLSSSVCDKQAWLARVFISLPPSLLENLVKTHSLCNCQRACAPTGRRRHSGRKQPRGDVSRQLLHSLLPGGALSTPALTPDRLFGLWAGMQTVTSMRGSVPLTVGPRG